MPDLVANRLFRVGLAGLTAVAVAGGAAYRYAARDKQDLSLKPMPNLVQPPPAPFKAHTDVGTPGGAPILTIMPESKPAGHPKIVLFVRGAVRIPGVHDMPAGARVQDLIDQAGGITADADLSDINIAAQLIDGSVLTIPAVPLRGHVSGGIIMKSAPTAAELNPPKYTRSGWRPFPVPQPTLADPTPLPAAHGGTTSGSMVNLNTASQAKLESLPGIGPVLAAQIIAYRAQLPFATVTDLANVPGIGPKRLEAVHDLVTVDQ